MQNNTTIHNATLMHDVAFLDHMFDKITEKKHKVNTDYSAQIIGYYIVSDCDFMELLEQLRINTNDIEGKIKILNNFYLCHKPLTFIKLLQFIHSKKYTHHLANLEKEIEAKATQCVNEILVYSVLNSLIYEYSYVARMGGRILMKYLIS